MEEPHKESSLGIDASTAGHLFKLPIHLIVSECVSVSVCGF